MNIVSNKIYLSDIKAGAKLFVDPVYNEFSITLVDIIGEDFPLVPESHVIYVSGGMRLWHFKKALPSFENRFPPTKC